MTPPPSIYSPSVSGIQVPLRQGELLSDLVQINLDLSSPGADEILVSQKLHPYAVIMTQDCDLEQDFKARKGEIAQNPEDKLIPNILCCEVIEAEQLRKGRAINSPIWGRIKLNKDERYHFLQKIEASDDGLTQGLPELGIDFKRYFTIPVDEMYKRIETGEAKRRSTLVSPYLEHLSSRFAYFLSRIALPAEHTSE